MCDELIWKIAHCTNRGVWPANCCNSQERNRAERNPHWDTHSNEDDKATEAPKANGKRCHLPTPRV